MTRMIRNGIALLGIVVAAACSPGDILEVETPDIIDPEDVSTTAGLAALYAGALGDFSFAMVGDAGGTEGQILVSGSFSDELGNSETFPTRKEYDQRGPINLQNGTLTGVFRTLHRARRSAERYAEIFKEVAETPADDARLTELYILAGFIYNTFGEHYCSGVPVSVATEGGGLTFGNPLTTAQLFDEAIKRFDSAAAYPGGPSVALGHAAAVGKARVLLNLDQPAAAAALVAAVPTDFKYGTTHTVALSRQQNGVFAFINAFERFSVANLDGGNGIAFRDAQDPRVPWFRTGGNDLGFDAATPQYDQGKYASETAPLTIASGVEARLIEAEAALRGDDPGTWLDILNDLRATPGLTPVTFPQGWPIGFGFPALGPLADPGTANGRVDLMFRERAFWLYLSGHRLGDLRRLVRQFGREGTGAGGVFPGAGGAQYVIDGNPKGGVFGTEMNLPVPFDEQNNPNFEQCIDRNP